ncbi:MAG TPA: DoxX family protein, partial [Thermoanaerobaculia bacterium]|nr:DoxX family protein [Thermoanaerobaculia bacterium]
MATEISEPARWSLATRIAFRFFFSYYALRSFIPLLIGRSDFLSERYTDFWDAAVAWADAAVFHVPYDVFDLAGNDSYSWVQLFCTLVVAGVITAVWSALDRNRLQYDRIHPWLRLLLRYLLAGAMIEYGAIKIIPSQMTAPPPLGVLLQPLGDIFPNHLLWWTVGASPVFETTIGLAELLGGVLLLVPRTTLLGALVSAANMLFVFLLNMCYDVPVKLGSLQLLVMAVVLVAPDVPRLADVFFFHRGTGPSRVPPLFR